MPTRPSAENLLQSVAEYLAELQGRVGGVDQFQLRVAAHLVTVVERDLRLGAEVRTRQTRALAGLLGIDGSLDDLNRELCRQIRTGEVDARFDEVLAVVAGAVDDELKIAAPNKREAGR